MNFKYLKSHSINAKNLLIYCLIFILLVCTLCAAGCKEESEFVNYNRIEK